VDECKALPSIRRAVLSNDMHESKYPAAIPMPVNPADVQHSWVSAGS